MGDLHFQPGLEKKYSALFMSAEKDADMIVLCGDLTTKGNEEEATALADIIRKIEKPVISVLGNHDYETNSEEEFMDILEEAGVKVLERKAYVTSNKEFGFAGTKGFGGGFLGSRIAPFGERILKMFVNESFKEANKVNRVLKNMDARFKIIVYHYSPVRETCFGENPEVMPFLGSSILADPAETFKASLILHGHAHKGREKGATLSGIPVRNAALPIHNRKYVIYDTLSFERDTQ